MKSFWPLFSFAAAGIISGSACSFQVIPGATLLFFSIQAQYALEYQWQKDGADLKVTATYPTWESWKPGTTA